MKRFLWILHLIGLKYCFQVGLASGKQLEADRVVLCLGNEKSLWPCGTEEAPSERLIGNPWAIGIPPSIPFYLRTKIASSQQLNVSCFQNQTKGVLRIDRNSFLQIQLGLYRIPPDIPASFPLWAALYDEFQEGMSYISKQISIF